MTGRRQEERKQERGKERKRGEREREGEREKERGAGERVCWVKGRDSSVRADRVPGGS